MVWILRKTARMRGHNAKRNTWVMMAAMLWTTPNVIFGVFNDKIAWDTAPSVIFYLMFAR